MDQTILNKALHPGTLLKSPLREYRIIKTLGAGGFGITYLVYGQVGNANVEFAIKEHFLSRMCDRNNTQCVTFSKPVADQVLSSMRDFIAEASRLNKAAIRHNNLVGINEVFEANNTAYYVMEYIKGDSLRKYVSNNVRKRLDVNEALDILAPVLDAIALMHKNRITHLDIKPENILLPTDVFTGKLRPVVIDFGLSKHYDENGNPTSTITFHGCSEGYSPLEQYVGIKQFSPTADVYALGATLYFMLTGERPLQASEITIDEIRSTLSGLCSPNICKAIIGAMTPDYRKRTQSIEQFAADLGITLPNAPGYIHTNTETQVLPNPVYSSEIPKIKPVEPRKPQPANIRSAQFDKPSTEIPSPKKVTFESKQPSTPPPPPSGYKQQNPYRPSGNIYSNTNENLSPKGDHKDVKPQDPDYSRPEYSPSEQPHEKKTRKYSIIIIIAGVVILLALVLAMVTDVLNEGGEQVIDDSTYIYHSAQNPYSDDSMADDTMSINDSM